MFIQCVGGSVYEFITCNVWRDKSKSQTIVYKNLQPTGLFQRVVLFTYFRFHDLKRTVLSFNQDNLLTLPFCRFTKRKLCLFFFSLTSPYVYAIQKRMVLCFIRNVGIVALVLSLVLTPIFFPTFLTLALWFSSSNSFQIQFFDGYLALSGIFNFRFMKTQRIASTRTQVEVCTQHASSAQSITKLAYQRRKNIDVKCLLSE